MRHWARRHGTTVIFIVIAAGAAIASLIVAPGLRGVCGATLALLMFAIAYYDARHLIIPNVLVGAALALALAYAAASEQDKVAPAIGLALVRAAITGGLFLAVKLSYRALRGRDGLGLGDVKLAGVAGAWLDWLTILIAIDVAVFVALCGYIVRQTAKDRPLRRTGMLPFGLYLAPAIWIGWLLEMTILAP